MLLFCFDTDIFKKEIPRTEIQSNMNALYVVCIGFVIIILMALTSIVSRQTMKIRALIQEIGMLEKRVRELEEEDPKIE